MPCHPSLPPSRPFLPTWRQRHGLPASALRQCQAGSWLQPLHGVQSRWQPRWPHAGGRGLPCSHPPLLLRRHLLLLHRHCLLRGVERHSCRTGRKRPRWRARLLLLCGLCGARLPRGTALGPCCCAVRGGSGGGRRRMLLLQSYGGVDLLLLLPRLRRQLRLQGGGVSSEISYEMSHRLALVLPSPATCRQCTGRDPTEASPGCASSTIHAKPRHSTAQCCKAPGPPAAGGLPHPPAAPAFLPGSCCASPRSASAFRGAAPA